MEESTFYFEETAFSEPLLASFQRKPIDEGISSVLKKIVEEITRTSIVRTIAYSVFQIDRYALFGHSYRTRHEKP